MPTNMLKEHWLDRLARRVGARESVSAPSDSRGQEWRRPERERGSAWSHLQRFRPPQAPKRDLVAKSDPGSFKRHSRCPRTTGFR